MSLHAQSFAIGAAGCKERVWDNGDMTDCGETIVSGSDTCRWHLDVELAQRENDIRDMQLKIAGHRNRIKQIKSLIKSNTRSKTANGQVELGVSSSLMLIGKRRSLVRNVKKGLCFVCGKTKPQSGRKRCRCCLDKILKNQKAYYLRKAAP